MPKNIQSIQFMRFVAALLVVSFHTTKAVHNDLGGIPQRLLHFTEFGASGVHLFFVISGFIMMYTSFSNGNEHFSPKEFFLRRIIRIYPIYWICCSFYVFAHLFFWDRYNLNFKEIIGSIFLFPGFSYLIIGPGWTLAYEVYFYACFGSIMCLGFSRGFFVLSLFFILSVLSRAIFKSDNYLFEFLSNSLLIEFIFGAAIAYAIILSGRRRILTKKVALSVQFISAASLILTYFVGYQNAPTLIIWGIPSALLIAALVFNECQGISWRFVKKLSFLGDSSYSLYLLHLLIIDASILIYTKIFAPPGALAVVVCFLIIIISVTVSIVFFSSIERRISILLRKLLYFRDSFDKSVAARSAKI